MWFSHNSPKELGPPTRTIRRREDLILDHGKELVLLHKRTSSLRTGMVGQASEALEGIIRPSHIRQR
jgi:S-adenosylhomocysteine hydrolase